MGDIDAALDALKLLKLGKKINYTQVAREYSVDRSTLSRRYRGENRRLLNTSQESELIIYIDKLCSKGLPLQEK